MRQKEYLLKKLLKLFVVLSQPSLFDELHCPVIGGPYDPALGPIDREMFDVLFYWMFHL